MAAAFAGGAQLAANWQRCCQGVNTCSLARRTWHPLAGLHGHGQLLPVRDHGIGIGIESQGLMPAEMVRHRGLSIASWLRQADARALRCDAEQEVASAAALGRSREILRASPLTWPDAIASATCGRHSRSCNGQPPVTAGRAGL